MSEGNGSLMRVAPIGLVFRNDVDAAMKFARAQSDITHPKDVCGTACAIYTRLITFCFKHGDGSPNGIATGDQYQRKAKIAKALSEMDIPDSTLRERLRKRCAPDEVDPLGSWKKWTDEDVKSSGWVVDTLDAALWAFFTTNSWQDGALRAVNLGGDADSVGAVYGGLAGAYYGVEVIPQQWRKGLVKAELVEEIARELAKVCGA